MQQQKKMKNRQTDNCEKTLTKYPQKILLLILPEIFTEIFTFSKGFFFFLNSLSFKTFTTQPTLIWFYSCKFRIKHSLQHSHFKGFFRCCQLHSKHLAQHSHPKSFQAALAFGQLAQPHRIPYFSVVSVVSVVSVSSGFEIYCHF